MVCTFMTTKFTDLTAGYYTPNNGFTSNDASFHKNKIGPATLHIAVSVQLIVYANITTVYTALRVCCQEARIIEDKLWVKNFLPKLTRIRDRSVQSVRKGSILKKTILLQTIVDKRVEDYSTSVA